MESPALKHPLERPYEKPCKEVRWSDRCRRGVVVVVPGVLAADVTPTVDTPLSFRATFKGLDTDPQSLGGNDFQVFEFNYWTVLVNLRGDAVDLNGDESGFYEIQLTRTGSKLADLRRPS